MKENRRAKKGGNEKGMGEGVDQPV